MQINFNKKIVMFFRQTANELRQYNYLYYIKHNPQIKDVEYDQLFLFFKKLENKIPKLKNKNSPSNTVGSTISTTFQPILHYSPMLSIKSSTSISITKEFIKNLQTINKKNTTLLIQPKIDGLSVELIYRNGSLWQGSTRGNGEIGEDITSNLIAISKIPKFLVNKYPKYLVIRGEIFISKKKFLTLNKNLKKEKLETFSSIRNAAAGSVRQFNKPKLYKKQLLSFFPFEIINASQLGLNQDRQSLELLHKIGFNTYHKYHHLGKELSFIKQIYKKYKLFRNLLPFEIDGIVIKVENLKLRSILGSNSKFPYWCVARKFQSKQKITTITEIINKIGHTGKITPIAILKPISINGSIIKKVTLHNYDEIKRLKLNVKDSVCIEKAGDIIPKITKNKTKTNINKKNISPPQICPACHHLIVKKGSNLFCPNTFECPSQLKASIKNYVHKEAANIEGLGPKRIDQLVNKKIIKNIASIYDLPQIKTKLIQLKGWNSTFINNLIKSIEKSKDMTLDRFLLALGIPNIGKNMAKSIAQYFDNFNDFYQAEIKILSQIDGIGLNVASSIKTFINDKQNENTIKCLIKKIKISSLKNKNKIFNKLKIKVIGNFKRIENQQIKKIIRNLGGDIVKNISEKTQLVITGQDSNLEIEKAIRLKIKIIDEFEFFKIINNKN